MPACQCWHFLFQKKWHKIELAQFLNKLKKILIKLVNYVIKH